MKKKRKMKDENHRGRGNLSARRPRGGGGFDVSGLKGRKTGDGYELGKAIFRGGENIRDRLIINRCTQ